MSAADVIRAQQRAELAQARLSDALAALKQRLSPRRVARDFAATTRARAAGATDTGVAAVKARPGIAIGIAALATLLLARKPIIRTIKRNDGATPKPPRRSPARPRKGKS